MKEIFDASIKKRGYFTQRLLSLKLAMVGASLIALPFGLLAGFGALSNQIGNFFLYWLMSTIIIWGGSFCLFSLMVFLQWNMVVIYEQGIKFRGYGKKNHQDFAWREIKRFEVAYEERKSIQSNDEVGSYVSHHHDLIINVFLIEGGKKSMDIKVETSPLSYTKNKKGTERTKLIHNHIKQQTKSLQLKPSIEKFKPRSLRKFKYTWNIKRYIEEKEIKEREEIKRDSS